MGYKVISYFIDLQDSNHAYNVGDQFPRVGLEVTEERIKELSGADNKQHRPLIEAVKVGYKKSEINRMAVSELQKLAESMGVENASDMTGAELKKILIRL